MAILKFVALFLAFILLAVLATLSTVLIQPNLLRGIINESSQRFAGLEVEIDNISSRLNPLRIEVEGLQLVNPDWRGGELDGELLKLDSLRLQMTRLPTVGKPFWDLEAQGVKVNVVRNEEGKLNWISDKLASGETEVPEEIGPAGPLLPADFNFNHIRLHDVAFLWRSGELEQRVSFPLIEAQRVEAANGELKLELDYREQHFAVDSRITLFDPKQGILDYQLNVSHSDLDLKTQGRLQLASDLKGSEIDIDLALRSLEQLGKLADTELPPFPAITLKTTLAFTPDYEFRDIDLRSGGSDLGGKLTITQENQAIRAELSSSKLDIDKLFPAGEAEVEEPDNGEESEMDWAWLDNLDIQAKAAVANLQARGWSLAGLTLDATLKESIQLDAALAEVTQKDSERRYSNIRLKGQAQPLASKTSGADLEVDLALQQEDITLALDGKVNINGLKGSALNLKGQAPSSAAVWKLAELPWQEDGALALEGSLASDGEGHTAKGKLNMGPQAAEFDVLYQQAERPNIEGKLSLSKLDLAFMSNPDAQTNTPEKPAAKKSKRVFSKEPLPLEAMNSVDANLIVELQDVDTGYNLIQKAQLNPSLQNGKFTLAKSTLDFAHGKATLSADFDSNLNEPTLNTKLSISSEDYGKLGLDKAAGISGGKGKIRFQAETRGQSPASLAANLDAKLDAKITDLEAQGNALNLIGSDLLSEVIAKLNPFDSKPQNTEIQCVAIHFSGENGKLVSNNGIALETDSTKIIGTGSVDLEDEQLSFGISPIARTGVGINIGAAAGLVRLGGSLSKPRIVADPSGMFTSGLSTGAALYTGGLSLLAQGMYKRAMYAGSSCDGSLNDVPEAEALPDELINPPPPAPDSPPAPAPAKGIPGELPMSLGDAAG